ncbi:hypothetical protein PV05_01682 [Exophiala xenobiotica]|uniref:Uncharacterized protein n=1 Tax=Exophiala xenobiotica TaxID=348802 RepID=A0A0D2F105_9EURO|nr:uncharacterized protein PV05_01682 [Exophiala xenobiotica]KIW61578.1 hypothetical protein PV05_01682 [Exophiala xenobiotica]
MQGGPVSPKLLNGNIQQGQRRPLPPTSNPRLLEESQEEEEEKADVVAELAAWRKDRKKAYEDELARYKSSRTGIRHARTGSSNSQINGNEPRGYGYGFDQGASNAANGVGRPPALGGLGSDITMKEINDIDMKFVEGHWKGEIKVVRNPTPQGRTGVVDMYGNYFEKGYLYP